MKGRSSIVLFSLIIVLGLVSVYIYFGHIAPLQQKVQTAESEVTAKQMFLKSTARTGTKAQTASTNVATLPRTADVSAFLGDFNHLLANNKVKLQSMTQLDKTSATSFPDDVKAMSYTIKVMGQSDVAMLAFIHELEQLPRFITLDTLEITHQGKATLATFNLTLYWGK